MSEQIDLYDRNDDFRTGYDTATDVATCYNELTVWHLDEPPESGVAVLVFVPDVSLITRGIRTEDGWWSVDGLDNVEPKRVTAWMEMPELPITEEDEEEDEAQG